MKKKHQLFSLVTLLLVTVTAISCRDNRNTNEAPNTYPSDYETERQDEYMGTPTDDPMYAPDTLNGSMERTDMRESTQDTIYHRTN